MIFIPEILDLEDNFGGKNNHFLIKLQKETIHMKCDDPAEKDKWFAALRICREKFANDKATVDDRDSHKEAMDPRILQIIVAEQESELS